MAVQTRFPVQMEDVFPQGAYMIGEVIAADDFEKKRAGEVDPQLRDKISGQRVWQVRVLDPDPESRKGQAEVTVKVSSDHQPVPPKGPTTGPFRAVAFEGLTLTPYVDTSGNFPKIAYSLRATGFAEAKASARTSSTDAA